MEKNFPKAVDCLLDRLSIGFSTPDGELFCRAENCARFFEENPEQRVVWASRLRRAGENPLTTQLWDAIKPIIEPQNFQNVQHAAITPPSSMPVSAAPDWEKVFGVEAPAL